MADSSKISPKIQEQVESIKKMTRNEKKIDTPAEYQALSQLLAGEKGLGNREYIEGFILEYEKEYPSLEQLEAQKAQEEMMKGLTKDGKKEIDSLLNEYDKLEKKYAPNDHIEAELRSRLNDSWRDFTDEERQYLKQELEKRRIDTSAPTAYVPSSDKAKYPGESYMVSSALRDYTTEADQQTIKDGIAKVDSDNVLDFLGSFTYGKEGFFERLITELGFDEKYDLAKKVAEDLKEYTAKYNKTADNRYAIDSFIRAIEDGSEHNWDDSVFGFGVEGSYISNLAKDLDKFVHQEYNVMLAASKLVEVDFDKTASETDEVTEVITEEVPEEEV